MKKEHTHWIDRCSPSHKERYRGGKDGCIVDQINSDSSYNVTVTEDDEKYFNIPARFIHKHQYISKISMQGQEILVMCKHIKVFQYSTLNLKVGVT